jgi:hypothetical protein
MVEIAPKGFMEWLEKYTEDIRKEVKRDLFNKIVVFQNKHHVTGELYEDYTIMPETYRDLKSEIKGE